MQASFVHLRVHSEFSLVDGIVRIKPLVSTVAAAHMPAVAITDQSNLFGMVKFYRAAQNAGVKPIIGVDVWLHNEQDPNNPSRLVLLCKDHEGYLNLTHLVSQSYLEGQHRGIPILQREWLQDYRKGLIVLSGGREGDVGQALLSGNREQAATLLTEWIRLFGDNYYLELQRTGREGEDAYLSAAVDLAATMGVAVVATNSVCFLQQDDFDAHEARVCINDGRTLDDPRRPHHYTDQQYLRSPEEMIALFADIPEAIENSVEIARRCNLELTLGENFLPNFPIPAGMTMDEFFRQQSREGLERRLTTLFDTSAPEFAEQRKPYDERLELELDVIIDMGFPGYFLIVADFIRWSKDNDIPVGPGRGSGAGSLVAYAQTITDLDPIKYELLFERFLNPERVSMPDFDVDFCMEGRDRVIDYVADKYGRDHVSQIITYGTMAAKAVVRDVGRVLGHPYGFVDQIAKLIPFDLGITLDKALEQEETLRERYQNEEDVQGLIDLARSLEGITRNAGKHAGGVVIGPTKLTDFTPLYCEQDSTSIVSQFDKDDVEAVGLVKFDFLGLRTLTIIDWAQKTVNAQRAEKGEAPLDVALLPTDDEASFKLLKRYETTAVFQLESRGMKDLIKRLQPDDFEEIIALVALYRPGPLQSGMVDDFINRKHGRQKVEYPHPALEPILKPTYGVILYQEQVMQIAQVLAGYTLGGADMLRRAMGKKKPEEMAKQRDLFTEGAVKNGVEEKTATYIFDLMEKFAGYGFNKSHSAAYALVSYQTAWLKAHYPAAFMAAVLSSDMDNTDKVVTFIDDCDHMGLVVEVPDVNRCDYRFTTPNDKSILYGLGAIKGVGAAAIESIVAGRKEAPYKNLFDFCQRVDVKKVNRRVLEALIRAGAMDNIGPNRATLTAAINAALKVAEQHLQNDQAGVEDMFGFADTSDSSPVQYDEVPEWNEAQRLLGERDTLGLYLTGHPIEQYQQELKQFVSTRLVDLNPQRKKQVVVAGLVIALRTRNTQRGKMAFVTIDDRSARHELAMFSETYDRCQHLLAKDKVIIVQGEVVEDSFSGGTKINISEVYDVEKAREHFAKGLTIKLDQARAGNGFIASLESVLTPFREGSCPIYLDYHNDQSSAKINLGEQWRVRPTDELLNRLSQLMGEEQVSVEYR